MKKKNEPLAATVEVIDQEGYRVELYNLEFERSIKPPISGGFFT